MMKRPVTSTLASCLVLLVGCSQADPGGGAGAGVEVSDAKTTETERGVPVVIQPERDADGNLVPVEKTDAQWKAELGEKEYDILRHQGTERAFTGRYHDSKADGVYTCAGCGLVLFDSKTKFDSGTGWPSFYQPIDDEFVADIEDTAHGMRRVESRCARCGGHLGHVFNDGPKPTGQRFCMNGYSLRFIERDAFEEIKKTRAQSEK
jgi:peptide-methionine (R)-S-oxide reductase